MTSLSTQLLVLGGGATGLGIAWDACLRGLKVVLVEQGDIGQGTSGRYHGLLHSGGRYVVSDPASARDCAAENLVLRRLARHTIEDTGGFFAAAPGDPPDFAERWREGCLHAGVPATEISVAEACRREPLLNTQLQRVFAVQDASLDSFDLLHALVEAIRSAGGEVRLRHRVTGIVRESDRIRGATLQPPDGTQPVTIHAEMVVNATGPWARQTAALAGVDIPMALGKGTMVAMATRVVNTIVNRLKPPADGDIIVPVGTVAVLGTTDVPVEDPTDLRIQPWEIDLLLAEAERLIPGIADRRPLRAWAGVRPLFRPTQAAGETRQMPRAHLILDHAASDGLPGMISVIGGKLTTFRLMAEQTVDQVCRALHIESACRTKDVPLDPPRRARYYALPDRLRHLEHVRPRSLPPEVICECESVTREQIVRALASADTAELDDIRRDLRVGMGPCQAGFCAYRTAALAESRAGADLGWLESFLEERWRGTRPLAWGTQLRQMELTRRLYVELMAMRHEPEAS